MDVGHSFLVPKMCLSCGLFFLSTRLCLPTGSYSSTMEIEVKDTGPQKGSGRPGLLYFLEVIWEMKKEKKHCHSTRVLVGFLNGHTKQMTSLS